MHSRRSRPGPGKHSGKEKAVTQRKESKISQSKRRGRRRVGGGDGGGVGGRQLLFGLTRVRGSALLGQKLPKYKSWRLNPLRALGSQHGHIREKKHVSKDSPRGPGPPPRTRATTARDTKPSRCFQPKRARKQRREKASSALAGVRKLGAREGRRPRPCS